MHETVSVTVGRFCSGLLVCRVCTQVPVYSLCICDRSAEIQPRHDARYLSFLFRVMVERAADVGRYCSKVIFVLLLRLDVMHERTLTCIGRSKTDG